MTRRFCCVLLFFTLLCAVCFASCEIDSDDIKVVPTDKLTLLDDDFATIRFDGDHCFDEFLSNGGASTDKQVIDFLVSKVPDANGLRFVNVPFGCSTITVSDDSGGTLFGRNFDWDNCKGVVVEAHPYGAYSSISTVNADFLELSGYSFTALSDDQQAFVCMYAPIDGMNECGLAVSVNMIAVDETIEQNSALPDLTTTTAVRLLLDKASDVDHAIALLKAYDMHASLGRMVHFALADTQGNSAVVEYVDSELVVTQTPVVTNFYLAPGDKYGLGTEWSHTRYDILTDALEKNPAMSMNDVRDALKSVSRSTEWSIVFDLDDREAHYYHRENFDTSYIFRLGS